MTQLIGQQFRPNYRTGETKS